jgi:NitT/TauT family transport system substrate-binding protein
LQQGAVDAVSVTLTEPIQLGTAARRRRDRERLRVDIANGIVTNEKTIGENLDWCALAQCCCALKHTIADPEAAFTISSKFVEGLGSNPDSDKIQREVLAKSIDQWRGEQLGRSDPAAWDTTQDVLIGMGLLKQKIDSAQLFTNRFVDEVSR